MDEESFFSSTSQLVKSFWAGKIIQKSKRGLTTASKHGEDTLPMSPSASNPLAPHRDSKLFLEQAFSSVRNCGTSLSPRVHKTIGGTVDTGVPLGEALLRKDGTLNWSRVTRYFDAGILDETRDLTKGAEQCVLLAELVHRQCSEDKELSARIRETGNFGWTPQPEVYLKCLAVIDEDHDRPELQVNTAILLIAAALERALGDVFLSVGSCTAKQCPHLLKDLLATKELEDVFSPVSMFLLRCLIGPPTGLNLRNVLWHGFADHKEVPRKFAVLLLVVVASLGGMLYAQCGCPNILHRPFVTFPQENKLCATFKDLSPDSCQCLRQLFLNSYFILPTMLPTWEAVIQAFLDEEYTVCLCLLLPSLEHGLRRVFACINKCPERALTAEADAMYTTIDEILSPSLDNGEPNRLIEEVGSAKMEMLLDLLVHPEGLRLRDHISHGEVAFYKIGRSLANHVLCLAAVFCAKYSLHLETTLLECLAVESSYVSLFHPISLLKEEMEKLVHEVTTQWTTISTPATWTAPPQISPTSSPPNAGPASCPPHPSSTSFPPHALVPPTCYHPLCPPHTTPSRLLHDRILARLTNHLPYDRRKHLLEILTEVWSPLNTLFVARQQLELVGIMRRTVSSMTEALKQVKATAAARCSQYEKQELRSRQRTNYGVLVSSLPLYQECTEGVILFLALTATLLLRSPTSALSHHIKFHKKVLQFSENFCSHTSPTHNRWEEANKLCKTAMDSIERQVENHGMV